NNIEQVGIQGQEKVEKSVQGIDGVLDNICSDTDAILNDPNSCIIQSLYDLIYGGQKEDNNQS
ncbi:MAG: hypothetical protein PHN31_06840, partial [Candidatus Gracilibacteria bacterium]|nr:hypothetical protein [Candidatus Gracilibacteria bacterium]